MKDISFYDSTLVLLRPYTVSSLFWGGGPRVVVSTAAFHARFRGSIPGLGVWKKQNCFFPIHVWKSVLRGASVTER